MGNMTKVIRKKLIDMINNLNLQKNVFLYDTIGLEKVYEIIKISDIGVAPYLNNDYMKSFTLY